MKTARVLAVALLSVGCAQQFGSGLVPGQSTLAEVERALGPEKERRTGTGGETVLFYAHPSTGKGAYAARIGPDGKLVALEDRLSLASLNRLRPDVSNEGAVRDLLGPPHKIEVFPRQERTTWSYNVQGTDRQLVFQLSSDGVLREAYAIDNPALASAPE